MTVADDASCRSVAMAVSTLARHPSRVSQQRWRIVEPCFGQGIALTVKQRLDIPPMADSQLELLRRPWRSCRR